MPTALITGIRGQDGAYLASHLLAEGYRVVGADRRSGEASGWRLAELGIADDIEIVYMDLLEAGNVHRTIESVQPDEIYNLAAQSFVAVSFEQPLLTAEVDALGVVRILEALRIVRPGARFYQASTSEMFGKARQTPQSEETPFHPRSPYGIAKVFGHWATVNYREAHGLHASSGILFNHESPLRGPEFVTRKISRAVARISSGVQDKLVLGNLEAERDWGFAGDFVRAMWAMLQQGDPGDYVIGTGVTRSVKNFVGAAFAVAGETIDWDGSGADTVGRDSKGVVRVEVSAAYRRPVDVEHLRADSTKAARELGWAPTVSFEELVAMMVEADLGRIG